MPDPDWHPVQNARPIEWVLRQGEHQPPYGIVQRRAIRERAGAQPEIWFKVSTLPERELIGWCKTLEDAAAAGWDWHLAESSWQHAQAARRARERPGGEPTRPPAPDLVRAYRAAQQARDTPPRERRHQPSDEGPY